VLKGAHCTIRFWSENAVHLKPLAGFTGTELELFLHASDCIAAATLLHLDYQSGPRLRTHLPIGWHTLVGLKCLNGCFSGCAKYSVDNDTMAAGAQQKLQGTYWVSMAPVLHNGPRAD
jgi:hypothetical protein